MPASDLLRLRIVDQHPLNESPVPPALDEPTAPPPDVAARAGEARTDAAGLPWLLVAAAGSLAGIAMVLTFMWTRAETRIDTATPLAPASAPAQVVEESAPPPTWTGRRQAVWTADGSKTITFELNATHDVPVYMSRARPVLVIRCLYRRTEAFVVLGTSANFEGLSNSRTIQLQLDDDPVTVEQWERSESGQELFAPDGIGLVRRLAQAKRLHFGFTPFQAQPVTAEFAVEGFDRLAGMVASTCGWRLDVQARTRSARVS